MMMIGELDELVPPFHMKALYEYAQSSVHRDFFNVSNGGHNDTWEVPGLLYYQV